MTVASTSPDYAGMDPAVAVSSLYICVRLLFYYFILYIIQIEDYKRRVENYCNHYVPISRDHPVESRWSFFQCDHPNNIFTIHKATGKELVSLGKFSYLFKRAFLYRILFYKVYSVHNEYEYQFAQFLSV